MIARNLPPLPGIDTALIDGTPIPAMVRLNTLAAYQTLVEKSFDYAPAFAFDIEFDRIAKRKKLSEKTYRHHFKAAKLQDEQIHALDVSKLDFFKRYVNGRMNFHLDSKATIDIEFHRLAVHRSWGSRKFLQRWRELMQEARLLVGVPVAAPSHATNTTAPSETSGVQLPSSTLSDAETSTFTSSVTEHSPAPSTSSYFSSFVSRGYKPDPSVGFEEEFERLSLHEGWLPCDPERVRQWRSALEGELASQFGAADKLTSWQTLCMELGIDPPPTSITQCKKALRTKHVSIKALVNSRRETVRQPQLEITDIGVQLPSFITTSTMAQMPVIPRTAVKVFETVKELRKYCKKHKMFFPKLESKEDGFLTALLRHLTS